MDDKNNQSEQRSFQSSGYGTATGNQNANSGGTSNGANTNNQPPKKD